MTVLLHDAVAMLPDGARKAYDAGELSECVYADGTLLIGTSDAYLCDFLAAVAAAGRRYGMELHSQKFQVLPVRAPGEVCAPDGTPLPHVQHMQYLGAHLTADADMSHELGRKIGEAKQVFMSLRRLWSHSSLTWRRKLRIYAAVVESKPLCGRSSACRTKAQLRRLDGFQNRCIRQIIGVKLSYYSHVSNHDVLTRAGHAAASGQLLHRQLQLFGHVLRSGADHPLRACSFAPGSFVPLTSKEVRRIGGPYKEFVPEMMKHCSRIFGSIENAADVASSPVAWGHTLKSALFSPA